MKLQITKSITRSITSAVACVALVLSTGAGCRRGTENETATSAVSPSKSAMPSGTLGTKSTGKAPVKVTAKTPAPAKTPIKMTVSQKQGIDILKALNAAPALKGHKISVGTDNNTVMLNGKAQSAAQKKAAETIAHQQAKGYKIINKIEVSTG